MGVTVGAKGYLWLDGASAGEGVRLKEQVQPDKIKLLTPQEVAALGPSKAAALANRAPVHAAAHVFDSDGTGYHRADA